jgi:hypothetical protein
MLKNWNIMRLVRLSLGLVILIQSFFEKDSVMTFVGLVLTALPFFNIGGCAAGQCYSPRIIRKKESANEEIQFEEVKKKMQ